jgi:hypothetical protein
MRRSTTAVAILVSVSALAQEAPPLFVRDAVGVKAYASAPRLAELMAIAPVAVLGPSVEVVPEELEAIDRWNAEGGQPPKNGFTRVIRDGFPVRIGGVAAAKRASALVAGGALAVSFNHSVIWSGSVQVKHAYRFRLHLAGVKLPPKATLWIYGAGEPAIGFGAELVDGNGDLYTPTVTGEMAYIEIEIPSGETASFDIRDVVELIAPRTTAPAPTPLDSPTCLLDSSCVTTATLQEIASFRHAIAHLQYVRGSSSYVCSGTLLNDTDESTTIPYLLTANHCFSNQASATSLEAYFDYYTSSCGGAFPSISSKPRSNGSQLLATLAAPGSDFTLVKLNNIPAGRSLLGWTTGTAAAAPGTTIYRLSHPFPDSFSQPGPQSFTSGTIVSAAPACQGLSASAFLYSTRVSGGTYGGSSGGSAFLSNGQVVGQLFGTCGPTPEDGCNALNRNVDGAFSTTFPFIQQYVATSATQPCVPSTTVMCLANNRFSVKVDWKRPGGESGQGQAIKYTPESGLYWFFSSDNIELLVKVIDGCGLSNTYWVFSAATTNVQYTMTVVDTKTGQSKTYVNPQGVSAAAITDTNAFATCP